MNIATPDNPPAPPLGGPTSAAAGVPLPAPTGPLAP
jgi:hypothetical protein